MWVEDATSLSVYKVGNQTAFLLKSVPVVGTTHRVFMGEGPWRVSLKGSGKFGGWRQTVRDRRWQMVKQMVNSSQ